MYGLNEASRYWYNRVKEELISVGMKKSLYDEALFYYHWEGKLEGIVDVHVDDFILGGTERFHKNVIEKLKSKIEIGTEDTTSFRYLGMDVEQIGNAIFFSQKSYIASVEEIDIEV